MAVLDINHRVNPGHIDILNRVSGGVVEITERVGRNVIFGIQVLSQGAIGLEDYILQETGFSIELEDGSGSILKE